MSFVLLGILNSQAAGAGGGEAYDLLESEILSSSTSTITFTGLGSYTDYQHLEIRYSVRNSANQNTNFLGMRINGDSTYGNYYFNNFFNDGGNFQSVAGDSRFMDLGRMPASYFGGSTAFGAGIASIMNFSDSSKKPVSKASYIMFPGNTGTDRAGVLVSDYETAGAVTSLTFTWEDGGNFESGSRISLYGIKGA